MSAAMGRGAVVTRGGAAEGVVEHVDLRGEAGLGDETVGTVVQDVEEDGNLDAEVRRALRRDASTRGLLRLHLRGGGSRVAHPRTIAGVTLCVAPHGGEDGGGEAGERNGSGKGSARASRVSGVGVGGRGGGGRARAGRDRPRPFARGRGPAARRRRPRAKAWARPRPFAARGRGSPARRRRAPRRPRPPRVSAPSRGRSSLVVRRDVRARRDERASRQHLDRRDRRREATPPTPARACLPTGTRAPRGGQCGRTPRAASTARVGRLGETSPPPSTRRGCVEGRRAAKDHRRHEPRRCPGISARGERRRRSQTGAANSR